MKKELIKEIKDKQQAIKDKKIIKK